MKEETTPMKNTAQVLVDCLEAEGVDVIFGIPGEETLDLMFAIRDSKIRFIPTRHEQGAAFMADVYGRLTGHAGVCLSTLGPGATNLVTGAPSRSSAPTRGARSSAWPSSTPRKASPVPPTSICPRTSPKCLRTRCP